MPSFLKNIQNGTDLVGNIYYQGFDKVLIYERNISPSFFDLSTKMAGEILQKFSNYRVKLAIVGNFYACQNNSFNDFVLVSNQFDQINFVHSRAEAIKALSK